MKKTLLFFGLLSTAVYAQDCSKIFISEYVEGWSNNKALEIYNPTNQTIDLSQYFVARFKDGLNMVTNKEAVQLTGTIAPYDVYVAVLDQRDPSGTGQTAPIWDSLEVRGDGFYSPVYTTSSAFYWNGNDAVVLCKGTLTSNPTDNVNLASGFQIIDIFGKIGEDPFNNSGSTNPDGYWTSSFPYNTGIGVPLSADHSLIRKSTIKKGVTANPSFFNALNEYDSIPAVTYVLDQNGDTISGANGPILFGNWFSLGTHDCGCNPLAVNEQQQVELLIYPNPATDGVVYAKNAESVKEVVVINALGQVVSRFANNNASIITLRLGDDKGVFILKLVQDNGSIVTKRIVLK